MTARQTPSRRELFLTAMRRQSDGYVPFDFELCPDLAVQFGARFGGIGPEDHYGFPLRRLTARFVGDARARYAPFFTQTPGVTWNEWGVGAKAGSLAHFTEAVPALAGVEGNPAASFERFPLPDPATEYDWAGFESKVKLTKARGLVAVARMGQTIFETAWAIRGMENYLVDLFQDAPAAEILAERITAARLVMAEKYVDCGCDLLWLGDDVGTQTGMMMDPGLWRSMFKPRLARIIAAAKARNPRLMIIYHSDGDVRLIVPDLIEMGIDILNPVQPECMDPYEMKRTYGDRLSFFGTVGTQRLMPFGTPAQVAEECRRLVRELGAGGGFWIAPTHMLEPEVPWDNIDAFTETISAHNGTW
jgi:uroporphyrinogen decarboxylase